MVFWLCCLISILILIIAVLCNNIYLLTNSADEISNAFSDSVRYPQGDTDLTNAITNISNDLRNHHNTD